MKELALNSASRSPDYWLEETDKPTVVPHHWWWADLGSEPHSEAYTLNSHSLSLLHHEAEEHSLPHEVWQALNKYYFSFGTSAEGFYPEASLIHRQLTDCLQGLVPGQWPTRTGVIKGRMRRVNLYLCWVYLKTGHLFPTQKYCFEAVA